MRRIRREVQGVKRFRDGKGMSRGRELRFQNGSAGGQDEGAGCHVEAHVRAEMQVVFSQSVIISITLSLSTFWPSPCSTFPTTLFHTPHPHPCRWSHMGYR